MTQLPNALDAPINPPYSHDLDAVESMQIDSASVTEATAEETTAENAYLTLSTPGLLETLHFQPTTRPYPQPGEVEIEVAVAGLNFKEVLLALGLIPAPSPNVQFGLECAGKITALGTGVEGFAVGDEVMAFGQGCMSRWITLPAQSVAPKPAQLSLEASATIPIAFTTAYYALITVGRLRLGDRLLIHSAAGGVGQAAVAIAQWVGAEIFATAGNPEKQDFLRSQGIAHVMNSRSLDFAEQVMQDTNGEGVDVVLNSLGGEFIAKSLSVLGRYGRFLELGQRDILNDTPVGLGAFEKRLSFFAIQVEPDAPGFDETWQAVGQQFQTQHFQPLPHRVFPAAAVAEAFGYMAAASHIGKVVISLADCQSLASRQSLASIPQLALSLPTDSSRNQASAPRNQGIASTQPSAPSRRGLPTDFFDAGISPADGMIAFRRILGSKLPQVVVSTRDLDLRLSSRKVGSEERIQMRPQMPMAESEAPTINPSSQPGNAASHARPALVQDYAAPRNATEQAIATIWEQFLGVSPVGIHDSFFELGGHSLMATQVVVQMGVATQVDLSLNILFDHPTVAAVAQYVEQVQQTATALQASINSDSDDRAEIEL
ncbi:zinc-binding dehydrogenase [Acaryochloris marina]|uniref:zinc-binding dehydrogenase n=1 Tax=Acaryochloris marina TaxID=155978 RepID=UPI0005A2090E|nr:zinc-binding dehydrogenase [Acaryochloris marina]